jgi:hypothetical protein
MDEAHVAAMNDVGAVRGLVTRMDGSPAQHRAAASAGAHLCQSHSHRHKTTLFNACQQTDERCPNNRRLVFSYVGQMPEPASSASALTTIGVEISRFGVASAGSVPIVDRGAEAVNNSAAAIGSAYG